MNPLGVVRNFDADLYDYFGRELRQQQQMLSFIADDNPTSPLCAAIMGSVLFNTTPRTALRQNVSLENLAVRRICELFHAEHANIKTITIEAAARIVFQALTRRGDVVMSLDLRKKEHCNSENLVYRFVNFGIDPQTQLLDMEAIEKQAMACRPQMIVISPINYPRHIDYGRFAEIAQSCGAILWCDISQLAGLVAAGAVPPVFPHADVVTLTTHGALQGPLSSVILCKRDLAGTIDRMVITSGHRGLQTAGLGALAARIGELRSPCYAAYAARVLDNARELAEGLTEGGLRLIAGGSDHHLVLVDAKSCAVSARGAQELLMDAGVLVRTCSVLTQDPRCKFDGIRISCLPATTRGMGPDDMRSLGVAMAGYLSAPDDHNLSQLRDLVGSLASRLPIFDERWVSPLVMENLRGLMPSHSLQATAGEYEAASG